MIGTVTKQYLQVSIIRLPDVLARIGLSRSAVYKLIKRGTFPKQIKVGRVSGWLSTEVDAWISETIRSCRTDQGIA